ncbi:helix-turn-helix domain-containing protein, partial [Paracoccaceae bacterium]|nr:helix-turn-helix domain-containing protein [Paracoccaceae bacterium]
AQKRTNIFYARWVNMADGNFGFKVNGFDSYTLLLGEELRGERATFGKSLIQVQKELKIKAAYISAIENCDLDAFPNKGFVAGYVRSYARYLNLNPEEIYERFCAESHFSSHDSSLKIDSVETKKGKGFKDHYIQTQLDWKPSHVGFHEVDKSFLRKGYLFLGPFLVGFLILFGIGFGAWKVLIDIQKLKIVPANSLPIIMSEMSLRSSEIISEKKIKSYQLKNEQFGLAEKTSESIKLVSPQVSYRDGPILNLKLEDIGVLGVNSTKLAGSLPSFNTSGGSEVEMFAENEFPRFSPEIFVSASIVDRDDVYGGIELPVSDTIEILNSEENLGNSSINQPLLSQQEKENVVTGKVKTSLNIFAVKPSWIRINDKGSKVVFEKILKAGEVLEIKDNWFDGNLRAGNAIDLFFSLNGVTYGPVSDSRKVIKNFRIEPQNIFNSLKINDLKDGYLNSLLNNKRSF